MEVFYCQKWVKNSIERIINIKGNYNMNKILLINRLNPEDQNPEKKKIFFSIGEMDLARVENKIIDILNNSKIVGPSDLVLKYNGIELNITTQEIPEIIKLLSKDDIKIYNVFELYNPEL